MSTRRYTIERPDVILMAVTSQLRPTPAFGEVWLRHWQAAGLLKHSAIKPVVATFEQRLVVKALGSLDARDQDALRTVIGQVIG